MSRFSICHFHRALRIALAVCLVAAQTLGAAGQENSPKASRVTVEKGQILEFRLMHGVNSKSAALGDPVALTLTRPLVISGATVLPLDAEVVGRITKAEPAQESCKPGHVKWDVDPVIASDGTKIKLRGVPAWEAKPNGVLLDRLPPEEKQSKVGEGVLLVLLSPILLLDFVLISPWVVMDSFDGRARCKGLGAEDAHPEGELWYAAVSKSAKVSVQLSRNSGVLAGVEPAPR